MNYKTDEKNNDLYFKYIPFKKITKRDNNKNFKNNPFKVLSQLNLK